MSTPLAFGWWGLSRACRGEGRGVRAVVPLLVLLAACTGAASSSGPTEPACAVDADCDDGVTCTRDRCSQGACRHDLEPLACDDGNACTRDACHPEKGCLNLPDREGQACDDRDGCTTGDVCTAGLCAGTPASCDDGDPCTADACDPVAGACTHGAATDGTPCDDGDACTTPDACAAGVCAGGPDTCQCQVDADCAPLEDGDRCNGTLVCVEHACVVAAATVVTCDPAAGGECAKIVCEKATGACVPLAVHEGEACTPEEACATAAACAEGACIPSAWRACDDGDPCTADACDPASGQCVTPPAAADTPCDDANLCTAIDACDGQGACVGHEPAACDDGNVCTLDLCKPSTGQCVFAAVSDGQDCDDGDVCTGADACLGGQCTAGAPVTGCCHDTAECGAPGPCRQVACGAAHTCDVTVLPDCCGNGLLESGEACEPGVGAAPGACSDACVWQAFDVDPGVGGTVLYAHGAARHEGTGTRVVVSVSDAGPSDGLYWFDLDAGGSRLGEPVQVTPGAVLHPRVVSIAAVPQYGVLLWDMTAVLWHVAPGAVHGVLFSGPDDTRSQQGFFANPGFGWDADHDLDYPALGRVVATGFVQSAVYDFAPTVGYALKGVRTDTPADAPTVSDVVLARARATGCGSLQPHQMYLTDGASAVFPARGSGDQSSALNPAFVRLGALDNVVYVRVDPAPAAPRVQLVLQPVEDDVYLKPVVLWSQEGTAFYPFAPTAIEGADATYAQVFLPLPAVPIVEAPPLGLMRLGYDGSVTGPDAVLPEKESLSARYEAVRLGPDRIALVFDVLEMPDGMENPDTVRVGLSYAVVDDLGATVTPPTELLALATHRVPDWWVLPRPEGGFFVYWIQRQEGVGRLRARLVTSD